MASKGGGELMEDWTDYCALTSNRGNTVVPSQGFLCRIEAGELRGRTDMIYKRPACLAVATAIGTVLIAAAPAQARLGGGRGSSGLAVAHVAGRPFVPYRQFVTPFTPISAFYSYGPSYRTGAVHGGSAVVGGSPFVGLFPYRRFVTPVDGVGVFYEPYLSCWTWIPRDLGWQRVWECK